MLGSLASAIQLYSGGMDTGLRSPGTTNQQSESRLGGRGVVGVGGGEAVNRETAWETAGRGGQVRQSVCVCAGEWEGRGGDSRGAAVRCSHLSIIRR
ncbi:hypothetical protein EYF80_068204 [Liparis tanakae]|uniref:Uncharacterized protein n=1 Tax=Liparis tanakae TaxID=230148 RepID=A0A4Z2DYR0_9TELE|nr:hypothetical protein EYF80_068204 [Liparis tanakae]